MPERALTLAEILRSSGYCTLFFNSGNEFIDRAYGFCQGFEKYVYHPAGQTDAGLITRDFISRISAAGDQRFFAYLHYMDAHTPYTPNADNFIYSTARIKGFEPGNRRGGFKYVRLMTSQQQIGTAEQEHITALYDAQIRSIDQHIQKVLQALQVSGVLQNTIIIVTSDHGEEFWDHGNFEHGHTLYNELLHVPLLISGPGIAPAEVSAPVRLIDMAPTVLDLAQITAPPAMIQQGVSLLPLLQGADRLQDLPVFATGILYGPEKYCLIKDSCKLILNTDQKKNKWNLIGHRYEGPAEYYDLHSDPREQTNTLGSENQRMLQEELAGFRDMPSLFGTQQLAGHLKKDIRAKLEALGYVQ
jgi:arylsulfatase A-like enzyme